MTFPAQDFIRRLLEYDPERRMSLAGALSHEWLMPREPLPRHATIEETSEQSFSQGSSPLTSLAEDDADVEAMDMMMREADADDLGLFDGPCDHPQEHEHNGAEPTMRTRLAQMRLGSAQPAQKRGRGRRADGADHVPESRRKRKYGDLSGQNAAQPVPGAEEEHTVQAQMAVDGDESWGNLEVPTTSPANGQAAVNVNGHSGTRGHHGRKEPGGRATRVSGRGRTSGRAGKTGGVPKTPLHEAAAGMVIEEEHSSEYGAAEASAPKQMRSSRRSPAKVPRRA